MKRFHDPSYPIFVCAAWCALSVCAFADGLPMGPTVRFGDVDHDTGPDTLTINQRTPTAIVDYDSFDIGAGNTVNINQPSSQSGFLGRVVGSDASSILGNLNSNGSVYLVNPHGIFFGENAIVNVQRLVASTLDITDDDFINGGDSFTVAGDGGTVENHGTIVAQTVALLGESVANHGTIRADHIGFGAGHNAHVLVDHAAGGRIEMDFSGATLPDALVNHDGAIQDRPELPPASTTLTIASAGDVAFDGAATTRNAIRIDAVSGNVTGNFETVNTADVTVHANIVTIDASIMNLTSASGSSLTNTGDGAVTLHTANNGIVATTNVGNLPLDNGVILTGNLNLEATGNGNGGITISSILTTSDPGLPSGPTVIHGTVEHVTTVDGMDINVDTRLAIVHYDTFNVAASKAVEINLPNTNSAFLGRVTGTAVSEIDGRLKSNGAVYLLNPNGILVGASGVIDVHRFVGSTLSFSDSDFLDGSNLLSLTQGTGSLFQHDGKIIAADAVLLAGAELKNYGDIDAGVVALLAGGATTVDFNQSTFDITGGETIRRASLLQSGNIRAAGSVSLRSSGDITSDGAINSDGDVTIYGSDSLVIDGIITQGGNVSIESTGAHGDITIVSIIAIDGDVTIQASGAILDDSIANVASITADTLVLGAVGSIGAPSAALDLSATTLTATAGDDVQLNSISSSAVTLDSVTTIDGEISIVSAGTLTVNGTVGIPSLQSEGSLTASNLSAGDILAQINLATSDSTIDATAGTLQLTTANGSISPGVGRLTAGGNGLILSSLSVDDGVTIDADGTLSVQATFGTGDINIVAEPVTLTAIGSSAGRDGVIVISAGNVSTVEIANSTEGSGNITLAADGAVSSLAVINNRIGQTSGGNLTILRSIDIQPIAAVRVINRPLSNLTVSEYGFRATGKRASIAAPAAAFPSLTAGQWKTDSGPKFRIDMDY